jgi:hypothetical protein
MIARLIVLPFHSETEQNGQEIVFGFNNETVERNLQVFRL